MGKTKRLTPVSELRKSLPRAVFVSHWFAVSPKPRPQKPGATAQPQLEPEDQVGALLELDSTGAHRALGDFLRAVRAHEATRKTAFIMLTGRADKELVQRAMQVGVNNYIVKPFSPTSLRAKIEEVFGALT